MDMDSPLHNHMEMEKQDQIKDMKIKLIVGGILSIFIF